MKPLSLSSILLAAVLGCAGTASAQLITPTAITGSGNHVHDWGVIADGLIPQQGNLLSAALDSVWWFGLDTTITVDFGGVYLVNDVLVSVDNNDRYSLDYSLDGSSFANLFLIRPAFGEVPSFPGGMDTMTTNSTSPDYVSDIDFAPISARYLRFRARGGDGLYALGELEAFGVPVPESSTYGMLGAAALTSLVAYRQYRRSL